MTRNDSSFRRFFIIIAAIFVLEFAIMMVLHVLSLPLLVEAVIDAYLLVLLLFPILYCFVLSPLLREITERKRGEAALQESEERYRRLVEYSPDAIAVHNGSKFLYINAAGAELLGVATPGELMGRAINDFIHPDYLATIADQTKRIRKTGRSETVLEEKFCCLDGSVIDVEVVSTYVAYRGEPAVQAVVRNITERKRAELRLAATYAKLRERKAFIESIVSNLQSGIMVTDLAQRIRLANPYAMNCFNRNHGNLNGKSLRTVCPELDQSMATGADCAEIVVHRDAGDIIVGYNRFDLKGLDDAVVGNIISFVDLTEIARIRREMKLKERLATMGEVVAQVAHEMRNPLFGMTAVGQILEMELELSQEQKQLMNSFMKEARRLNNLVEELLGCTKELILRKKSTNLRSIIDASIAANEMYAQEKGVAIVKFIPDQQLILLADPEKIEQVILNLVKNAIEASGNGTEVRLAVETGTDTVTTRVMDAGHGIPEELQDKIFDIFFTTKRHGTGMGLSISKNIVEGHGGTLTAQNNADRGATFTVTLPLTGVTDESIGYR
ncbi:MAG: PAS domain S-box protein [Geobacteraceae bacterium]|nr:PAS domain S-box protein [Geobacteraceae bacterium]